MVTSLESHDNPVDKLNSDLNIETEVTQTKGSSFSSKIFNISTKILHSITAHPIISSVVFSAALIEGVALTILLVVSTPPFKVVLIAVALLSVLQAAFFKLSTVYDDDGHPIIPVLFIGIVITVFVAMGAMGVCQQRPVFPPSALTITAAIVNLLATITSLAYAKIQCVLMTGGGPRGVYL